MNRSLPLGWARFTARKKTNLTRESSMTGRQFRPGRDLELKVHDGIVGAIILLSVVVGMTLHPAGFWLAGVTSVAMIQSAFTGFCPIHFVLCKVIPAAD